MVGDREIPCSLVFRTGAIISFDRLRRETDEISTKYNRSQKPVKKRGRPHGGRTRVPNVGHHRLVFEKMHKELREREKRRRRSRYAINFLPEERDRRLRLGVAAGRRLSADLSNSIAIGKQIPIFYLM